MSEPFIILLFSLVSSCFALKKKKIFFFNFLEISSCSIDIFLINQLFTRLTLSLLSFVLLVEILTYCFLFLNINLVVVRI